MSKAKVWAILAVLAVALGGTAVISSAGGLSAEERREKDHWRHHDGHWSYWHEGDGRWYYTDGSHWFYEDGGAWKTYRFDKKFGREGFERGEYKVPEEEIKIVPSHKVYRR